MSDVRHHLGDPSHLADPGHLAEPGHLDESGHLADPGHLDDAAVAPASACSVDDDGCITCGDVAVPLTVVEVGPYDARCRADDGREEVVATELVGDVDVGARLLVHARVALERLPDHPHPTREEDR